ncbi:MAG: FAD-dependent oxidoreductase [Ferruginibacter sp.]
MGISKELIARGNRIKVDRQCRIAGTDSIYAIGDVAYMEEPAWPNGHPQVAPVAMQQADLLVKNLKKIEMKSGQDLEEFVYNDKGSMATVGRNLAVVDVPKPKLHFKGFFAWMIWMGLHLMLILGVKNRFFVFHQLALQLLYLRSEPSIDIQRILPAGKESCLEIYPKGFSYKSGHHHKCCGLVRKLIFNE